MSADVTRSLLEAWGYEVRFRSDEWVECLVLGDGRAFVGRGHDRASALSAVVRELCPTTLSARLFEAAVQQYATGARQPLPAVMKEPLALGRAIGASADHAHPASEGADDSAPRTLPTLAYAGSNGGPRPVFDRDEGTGGRSPGQIAVIVSRPAEISSRASTQPSQPAPMARAPLPRSPSGAGIFGSYPPPAPAGLEDRLPDPRISGDPDRSLEELDVLMDRIRDCREELGLCAPDRQRLAMLAWICEARSHTDAFPDDLRIRDRVGAISRQLTEIGKTFWPGSVTALQLHIEPRDLPRHLLGGAATTWHRAAELSEQALRNKEHEDERRGYDGYGWADARSTIPRPLHAARLLEELVRDVERVSGSLETQAAPADASCRPDAATFQRWVRQLRWLRGADVDPALWARVGGRLRWWAFRREPALQVATRELEPGYLPPYSWASLLGQDPERRRYDLQLREALNSAASIGPDQDALVAWLSQALPFGDTHHANVVLLMEPFKERVLEIPPELLPEGERRLRRRLVKLQDDLKSPPADLKPAPMPEAPETAEGAEQPLADAPSMPEDLVVRVRPLTEGKRAVLVSNRRDPDLTSKLQDTFRFALLDLKIAEVRRLEALGDGIQEGQYDLVLAATGFQSQGVDSVLAKACRGAGVRYVRVNRGRPMACLRALLRSTES